MCISIQHSDYTHPPHCIIHPLGACWTAPPPLHTHTHGASTDHICTSRLPAAPTPVSTGTSNTFSCSSALAGHLGGGGLMLDCCLPCFCCPPLPCRRPPSPAAATDPHSSPCNLHKAAVATTADTPHRLSTHCKNYTTLYTTLTACAVMSLVHKQSSHNQIKPVYSNHEVMQAWSPVWAPRTNGPL